MALKKKKTVKKAVSTKKKVVKKTVKKVAKRSSKAAELLFFAFNKKTGTLKKVAKPKK